MEQIDLNSVEAMAKAGRTLHVYCVNPKCQRPDATHQIDLEAMIRAGKGGVKITRLRATCQWCGERGQIQIRLPDKDWRGIASTWGGVSL